MDLLTHSEAQQHCQLLSNHIDEAVQKNGGWLSFAHYMNLALYTPRLGYYSGGAFKFGEKGDFITAPEISPLFGQSIAHTIGPVLDYLSKAGEIPQILEFGAGSGKLCQDLLTALHNNQQLPYKYLILEVSSELISRQKARLLAFLEDEQISTQIEWISEMPSHFKGVILANEVLDAIPVELIIKNDLHWHYLGISINPKPSSPSFSDHWLFTKGTQVPLSELPQYLIDKFDQFPEGYTTEIHPQSIAWLKHLAQNLEQGIFLTFDYGFPEQEYYHEQRVSGTHIAHHRHQAIPDMFYLPGLCDLTSHVEWSTLNRVAQASGLSLLYYQCQGSYLLQTGIGNLFMQSVDSDDAIAYTNAASALQKLISEAEMGELFKVIAWTKNQSQDPKFEVLCTELPGFTGRQRLLEI
jgi:SAM-dependent MidA family methyltransferase